MHSFRILWTICLVSYTFCFRYNVWVRIPVSLNNLTWLVEPSRLAASYSAWKYIHPPADLIHYVIKFTLTYAVLPLDFLVSREPVLSRSVPWWYLCSKLSGHLFDFAYAPIFCMRTYTVGLIRSLKGSILSWRRPSSNCFAFPTRLGPYFLNVSPCTITLPTALIAL